MVRVRARNEKAEFVIRNSSFVIEKVVSKAEGQARFSQWTLC